VTGIDPRILSQMAAQDFEVEEAKQTLARLEKRRADLVELEKEHAAEAGQAKTRLDELRLQLRHGEREIADLRRQAKLHSGHLNEIQDSREWRALNEEIRYLQRQAEEKEEAVLLIMEEAEKAEAEFSQAQEVLGRKREEIAAEREQLAREETATRERLARRGRARDAFFAEIPLQVRTFYERRGRRQSMPVVWLWEDSSCGYCHHQLTPQARLEVLQSKGLVVCESCGRIIVAAPVVPSAAEGRDSSSAS
jgi:predicted  nucleic acid-binding Zn-ribbon protein